MRLRLVLAALVSLFALVTRTAPPATQAAGPSKPTIAYQHLQLPNGDTATVWTNGLAEVFHVNARKGQRSVEFRRIAVNAMTADPLTGATLPDKPHLIADLAEAAPTPYASDRIIAVYRAGVSPSQDVLTVPTQTIVALRKARSAAARAAITPSYTNSAALNTTLGALGVDRSERLFRGIGRSQLATMHDNTQAALSRPILDFSNAYRLHVTGASVQQAVTTLLSSPDVVYASPDWRVASTMTSNVTIPAAIQRAAQHIHPSTGFGATTGAAGNLPSNFALTSSAQSMLNAPGLDLVPAYDEIASRFHQLPGQGEIITNVSVGDVDSADAAANPNDPCSGFVQAFGPTTELINGQHYLDWPSMPLIPAYTSDLSGNVSGSNDVCGTDPFLGEVGLDFSMMSPLPHNLQRPDALGAGFTDLLGVAPGASYRLVVPGSFFPTFSDIDAAFLAAAQQTPAPNVISASLGFGLDTEGFAGRYLEDDPLSRAVIAAIVHQDNIVVSISSNDGLRTFTNAAFGPSGGSVATNRQVPGHSPTDLNDIAFSDVPSEDYDSGAIAVGGTTLDDIFAAPPQDPANSAQASQHAFAETRWTGFAAFSSGFGTRVDVSAPSDNVLGLSHHPGGDAGAVDVGITGGTSASAPETAAAAAVALQVARLTGRQLHSAVDVRDLLARTATPVPPVPQADVNLQVGPQIDVGHLVESLLQTSGQNVPPSVPRVAVEQRQNLGAAAANYLLDSVFVSATDPATIDLQGPTSEIDGSNTDANEEAWITIAPDWEGLPPGATFRLTVAGQPSHLLAATQSARLLPAQILTAAGMPVAAAGSRTVTLTYTAADGNHTLAQTTFSLTFGPADATTAQALAPLVPAVVSGSSIPVTYDLSNVRDVSHPILLVSEPGRADPAMCACAFHTAYSVALPSLKGTIQVPVSALQGGGIYGIGIQTGTDTVATPFGPQTIPILSDFAFTRVAPAGAARPDVPLLSANGTTGHDVDTPYNGSFQVSWDLTNVPGATDAMIEISAAGMTAGGSFSPFNNPNGSERDNNGIDTGSVYYAPVQGKKGTVTIVPGAAGLIPTMDHVVRVIPLHSGVVAGEASGVSTIVRDGIKPADGGFVNNGFGVNGNGNDGFLTSDQTTADGTVLGSLETFDQSSKAITGTVASGQNHAYFTLGSGIFANDVGLFGDFDFQQGVGTFDALNPTSSGTISSTWTPPAQIQGIDEAAANQVTDNSAFLGSNTVADPNSPTGFDMKNFVFTSNVGANTFSSTYDLTSGTPTYKFPFPDVFAQNTTTNTSVTAMEDLLATNFCDPPTLVATNLGNGHVDSFPGVTGGSGMGLAIDSATNRAAMPTACDPGIGIYDLSAGTGKEVPVAPFGALYTAADQAHSLFLTVAPVGADIFQNNNGLSDVMVLREDGTVVKTLERFNFLNSFLQINANNLQLNPQQSSGFTFGPGQQQLEPFSY